MLRNYLTQKIKEYTRTYSYSFAFMDNRKENVLYASCQKIENEAINELPNGFWACLLLVIGFGRKQLRLNLIKKLELWLTVLSKVYDNVGGFVSIQPMSMPTGIVFQFKCRNQNFSISRYAIEAKSRLLRVQYPIRSLRGGRDDTKFKNLISDSIANEIIAEIMSKIIHMDIRKETLSKMDHKSANILYYKLSLEIQKNTERGVANFIVMNKYTSKILESNGISFDVQYSINENIPDNKILLACGGRESILDAGCIYAPYELVSDVAINVETFEPTTRIIIRYNMLETDISKNYYAIIELNEEESNNG